MTQSCAISSRTALGSSSTTSTSSRMWPPPHRLWRITVGVGMGLRLSSAVCDVAFWHICEKHLVPQLYSLSIRGHVRYRDDICLLRGSRSQFHEWYINFVAGGAGTSTSKSSRLVARLPCWLCRPQCVRMTECRSPPAQKTMMGPLFRGPRPIRSMFTHIGPGPFLDIC